MSTKYFIFLLLIISLVGLISGHLLTNSYDASFCYSNIVTNTFDVSCHSFYESIGNPIFYGMSALAGIFLVLFLLPQTFQAWKKFAVWFIPIAILIFIFYPNPGSGDYFSPYPEEVYKWVSILYVAISVGVIGWTLVRKQKRKST